jgi:putative ABC transport system permease protein
MSHPRPKSPRLAMWILRVIARRDDYGCVAGDFEEIYWSIVRHQSVWSARLWLVFELLNSIPRLAKTSLYWSLVMFANYVKTAFRNMRRHKGFTFINVSGLALGFACSMLIALFVAYELSYDRFNEKADRIYRVVRPGDRSTPPAC